MTTLVWDTSPLWHAALADRLDVLGDLASGPAESTWQSVTTQTVVAELRRNGIAADLHWLEVVNVDELDELTATMRWAERFGVDQAKGANIGEATVCAWASCHNGIAIIDDRDARTVAAHHKIDVHGSLWVVANAVNCGHVTSVTAERFVDALIDSGARYPCTQGNFTAWAKGQNLISAE